jgi:hypothetical protein
MTSLTLRISLQLGLDEVRTSISGYQFEIHNKTILEEVKIAHKLEQQG